LKYQCILIVQFQTRKESHLLYSSEITSFILVLELADPQTALCIVYPTELLLSARELSMDLWGWMAQQCRYQWFPRPTLLHVISAIDVVRRISPTGALSYGTAGNDGKNFLYATILFHIPAYSLFAWMCSRAIYSIRERVLSLSTHHIEF